MARRRGAARRAQGGGFRATPAALTAIALTVVAIILIARWNPLSSPGEGAADDVVGGGAGIVTEPMRQADGLFAFLGDALQADSRIKALERENSELRQWRTLALALAERNERYEALLNMPTDGLAAALAPNAGAAARVMLDVGGPFRRTLLANAGADHGVKPGAVAVNEHGLVGRVVLVGQRTSRVLMLDDYNSRVPVMGQLSRVRAVLVGAARATPRLEGPIAAETPGLEFVVGAEGLKAGEPIVTSGDGGLFPAGLVVGYAVQDGAKRWRVRLATADAPIDFVRLLPYVAPEAPEANAPAGAPATGVPMPAIVPRALSGGPARIVAPTPAVAPRATPAVNATRPIATNEDEAPPLPDQGSPQGAAPQ